MDGLTDGNAKQASDVRWPDLHRDMVLQARVCAAHLVLEFLLHVATHNQAQTCAWTVDIGQPRSRVEARFASAATCTQEFVCGLCTVCMLKVID